MKKWLSEEKISQLLRYRSSFQTRSISGDYAIVRCANVILDKLHREKRYPIASNEEYNTLVKAIAIVTALKYIIAFHMNYVGLGSDYTDFQTLCDHLGTNSYDHNPDIPSPITIEAFIIKVFDFKYICPDLQKEQIVDFLPLYFPESSEEFEYLSNHLHKITFMLYPLSPAHDSVMISSADLVDMNASVNVHNLVAQGGFGMVHKVTYNNNNIDHNIVRKKLPIEMSPDNLQGITIEHLREIVIMQSLDHVNIMKALGAYFEQDVSFLYILMDDMLDVRNVCRRLSSIDTKFALACTRQLLEGCSYLHNLNIIHRDLKPANLLLNPSDHKLKIADLGQTRYIQQLRMDQPVHGMPGFDKSLSSIVGTYPYRAIEITLSHKNGYTISSDMWSVGCIVYELFNLVRLFPGSSGDTNEFARETRVLTKTFKTFGHIRKVFPADQCAMYTRLGEFESRSSDLRVLWEVRDTPFTYHLLPDMAPFVVAMLNYDPISRITADQALKTQIMRSTDGVIPNFVWTI